MATKGLAKSQTVGGANYKGMTQPLPKLSTPAGSTMKAGSNTNAWENNLQFTPEQTAAGYGAVPAMTMNTPSVTAPQSLAQYGPSQTPYGYAMSQDAVDAGMNVPAPADGASWFTQNKDMINAGAQGLQALSGLANGYMASKNLKLAKDMFGFEKAATNRNIANQAQLVNNQIQNSGEVGMSLAGNTMDPNARAARQAQLNTMKVSGSPVG